MERRQFLRGTGAAIGGSPLAGCAGGGGSGTVTVDYAYYTPVSLVLREKGWLDEAFSALDRLTEADQQDHLLDVWEERGTTVVLVTHDVEEAVYLADRVVVLGGQPGTVESVVDVDIERPRERADADLVALRREVTGALGR